MQLLKRKPDSLQGRELPNSVAVHCDNCGNDFLWPTARGNVVTCQNCGDSATLPVIEVPTTSATVETPLVAKGPTPALSPQAAHLAPKDAPSVPAEAPAASAAGNFR